MDYLLVSFILAYMVGNNGRGNRHSQQANPSVSGLLKNSLRG